MFEICRYIKEHNRFPEVARSQTPFPPDILLVTINVTSLLTIISHQDDIQACREVLVEKKIQGPAYTGSGQTSDFDTPTQQF